ncbi:Alpha/Beta hydrolase protein [Lasiosphaeris hirsuta]|uniref:Alpha/Beta hydrolase protein n=1 Tax=Lasiosphaeris hirsuta TaxID=260670 RepID=A0AA40B063_9PEZI|nr:Alpha/Beta hydrolase protein [Lasiosphaeris hirsuta]
MPSQASSIAAGVIAGTLGVPVALYLTFIALSGIPYFQRHFLYAHKVHSLWFYDPDEPEYYGFAKNQVTPFSLSTEDGQSLYAWHVLPLPLYAQHEERVVAQASGFCNDITQTENFKILKADPVARLVIYLHGNAGHVAQAFRPASYHSLTETSSYHVLAIDYRGFGHSSGSPTEQGLILDATAAVRWAMDAAGVRPDRIVLLGQSLGTAVASGVTEYFAREEGVDFAGVILVSGFSSLPAMLSGYAIAGLVPILAPFKAWPWLLKQLMRRVVDKWASTDRLRETVRAVKARGGRLRLHLVHAVNDKDIPCHEDDKLFAAAVNGTVGVGEPKMDDERLAAEKSARTVVRGKSAFVATWTDGDLVFRQELVPYGGKLIPWFQSQEKQRLTSLGHNDIMCMAPVALAVMRCFDLVEKPRA